MRRPGGFAFAEDPRRPAPTARLFWSAPLDPRVIVVDATPTCRTDPQHFDLFRLTIATTALSSPGGEEILLGDGPRSVRISVATGSLLAGPVRLAYRLAGTDALDIRLLALRRFAALQHSGRLPKSLFEPRSRVRRWTELITALEALAIAPSQRDVAKQLYGDARVAAEWDGTSDYLRSRVRRAITSARQLAAGRYLSLLLQ